MSDSEIVNRDDIRMAQFAEGSSFTFESFRELRIVGSLPSLIDGSHSALPYQLDNIQLRKLFGQFIDRWSGCEPWRSSRVGRRSRLISRFASDFQQTGRAQTARKFVDYGSVTFGTSSRHFRFRVRQNVVSTGLIRKILSQLQS
jgi:hypothetical protein